MNATGTLNDVITRTLLFGGLALVATGSLVAAPMARADIEFECKPGCWGAIAASLSNGQQELRLNYETRQDAEEAAVLWCDVLGETNDCELVTSGLGSTINLNGCNG